MTWTLVGFVPPISFKVWWCGVPSPILSPESFVGQSDLGYCLNLFLGAFCTSDGYLCSSASNFLISTTAFVLLLTHAELALVCSVW